MAITNGLLVSMAETKFVDEGNDDLSEQDWVNFLNLAVATICSLKPDAYAVVATFQLASGVLQAAPDRTVRVADVMMNVAADGETPGGRVTESTRDIMDRFVSGWQSETEATEIQHWMRVDGAHKRFLCYPPSDGTGYVMANLEQVPESVTKDDDGDWENQPFPLGDEYAAAGLNAILYHAFDEDTDSPGNITRSAQYYTRLLQSLQIKEGRRAEQKADRQAKGVES